MLCFSSLKHKSLRFSVSCYSQTASIESLVATCDRKSVQVRGWVTRSQKRGKVLFAHISDGLSGNTIQAIVPKELCSNLAVGTAVVVKGEWTKSVGSQQNMELHAASCNVLATDKDPRYGDLSPDVLRKKIYLRSKNTAFASLLRIRSKLVLETHKFFQNEDFVFIDTPILTANDCEGAGETFTVAAHDDPDFFGKDKMFLTVSGQLHLEAMVSGIAQVYTLNGGFRAEKQQSSTHMTEFRMLETEIAFCDNLDEICRLAEGYVRHCSNVIQTGMIDDFSKLGNFSKLTPDTDVVRALERNKQLPRITFDECVDILKNNKQPFSGNGLSRQNELFLVNYCESPLFVTEFPTEQKPFYMKRSTDGKKTLSFDLLFPGVGELAGGSVRENNSEELRKRGIPERLDWYLEGRERGKPISAGFGLGFERLLQTLLGVKNIKDTTPFPRWFKHCQC